MEQRYLIVFTKTPLKFFAKSAVFTFLTIYLGHRKALDIRDILDRYTIDVIGSVAFGLECNSLKDPDATFLKYGKKRFYTEGWDRFKYVLQFMLPHEILKAMKVKLTNVEAERFFMEVVHDTVAYREKNNIYRKDFMHLLLELKNRGSVTDDEKITDEQDKIGQKALTMNELVTQAFVFFVNGFETSSTTMTFAMYELAKNPQLQDELREEINSVLAKHHDELTYDAMMEMTYMEKVIKETLRKHPPVGLLSRKCTQDYTVPKTSIQLKKGVGVGIPVLALHHDPRYYPDPEVFDPERFSEEKKNSRPAFTWLPFDEGPRECIGLRFGMLQSKVGLTVLLKHYRVTLNKRTKQPLKLDPNTIIRTAEGVIWLDVEKLH